MEDSSLPCFDELPIGYLHNHPQVIPLIIPFFHGHFPSTLGPFLALSWPIRTSLRFCMAFSRRPSSAAAKSCWETRCRSASRSFPALSKRCRRPSSQDPALGTDFFITTMNWGIHMGIWYTSSLSLFYYYCYFYCYCYYGYYIYI